MPPEPQSDTAGVPPEQSAAPRRSRRGRRGGRGRRARGRAPTEAAALSSTAPEQLPEPDQSAEAPAPAARETPPSPSRRDFKPAAPAAVTQAIEQVNRIIETLNATLEDMQEVLETVELAERQKNADEQEIETLRRSLRQLHRPRDEDSHSGRH